MTSASEELPGLGDVIAEKYMIRRVIGEGGMGVVFQAEHLKLRQQVAIKFLKPQFWHDAQIVARFDSEARAVARLRGPHVVRILDVDVLPSGAPYIVQELLEGRDLHAELRALGRLPVTTAVDYVRQAALGIQEAHDLGIVHRDLKPGNLFLSDVPDSDRRHVRVLDFGISKSMLEDEDSLRTSSEATVGTAPYMSPEQLRGSRNVDGRTDIWALGVILFELLTGSKPFKGSRSSSAVAIVVDPAPFPSVLRKDIPPPLEDIILRALEKSPDDRFPTARELAAALAAHGPSDAITTTVPAEEDTTAEAPRIDLPPQTTTPQATPPPEEAAVAAPPSPRPPRPPRRGILLALGAVGAIGVAGVLVFAFRPPRPISAATSVLAARECSSNSDCMKAHEGAAWICRKNDFKCAALESADCKIVSEPGDIENDRTIWVGAMLPTTGPLSPQGTSALHAIELARTDFVQMTHGAASLVGNTPPRPIALLACDDSKNAQAIAHHLVDDVGVPAVLGFGSSQEVIDLATTLFIPRGVLTVATTNGSAQITAIPHPPGTPRMVWRSTTNSAAIALPVSAVITDLLEPKIRAGKGAPAATQLRVALLRRSDAYGQSLSGALFEQVRFNGKSLVENGLSFHEFMVKDAAAPEPQIIDDLLKFRPHLIICASTNSLTKAIVEPVEKRWPAREAFKPYLLFSNGLGPEALSFLGSNKERRSRFFGIATPSNTVANIQLTTRHNEVFPDKVALNNNSAESYDGMYLVAYAASVAGETATGPELARAMSRLVPPGKPIDVGPLRIYEAIETLRRGENIDLNGAMTTLDFDLSTGETRADYVVECAGINEKGVAASVLESGLVFQSNTKKLVGKLSCP